MAWAAGALFGSRGREAAVVFRLSSAFCHSVDRIPSKTSAVGGEESVTEDAAASPERPTALA